MGKIKDIILFDYHYKKIFGEKVYKLSLMQVLLVQIEMGNQEVAVYFVQRWASGR